ncbi:dynein heavy chain 12, axonemal isoform X3 [Zootermopsis nevadensis]|nr:dynein heavy chain 12, axonemal isoform X3 [Zootermopsis nevadensis]XP_021930630.1 dynein heavy chain 12, axonemal isoform X3 [Zootermopsis nevadensis]
MEEEPEPNYIRDLIEGKTKLRKLRPAPPIDRFRNDPFKNNPLMTYCLEELKRRETIESQLYLAAKKKIKTARDALPVVPQHALTQSEVHQRLKHEASKNRPPPLTAEWKECILNAVPIQLRNKFPTITAALLAEVEELYERDLKHLWIKRTLKHLPAEELSVVTMHPYREGRTENYKKFLRTVQYMDKRLLLTHNLMRRLVDRAATCVPELIVDFTKYRDVGPIELVKWKELMAADLKKADDVMGRDMFTRIVNLFRQKNCMKGVRCNFQPQFLKCATFIVSNEIAACMLRTIKNVVDVTADMYKIPYLKIDLVYEEETGIQIVPTVPDIIAAYHKIIDDITGVAQQLVPLESWTDVDIPPGYITVKVLPEHTDRARRIIQENVEKLYAPVEVYRQCLVERYKPLYGTEVSHEIETVLKLRHKAFRDGCQRVKFFCEYCVEITGLVNNEYFNIVKLSQCKLKTSLKKVATRYIEWITTELVQKHEDLCKSICKEFEDIVVKALSVPRSTEELVEMGRHMLCANTTDMEKKKADIAIMIHEMVRLMDVTSLTQGHIGLIAETISWVQNIKPVFRKNSLLYEQYKSEFEENLAKKTESLMKEIEDVFPRLALLNMMDHTENIREYLNHIRLVIYDLQKLDETIEWINKEEGLFQFPVSTYPELDELKSIICPFGELIFLVYKWQRTQKLWLDGNFYDLVARDVEEKTDEFYKDVIKAQEKHRSRLRQQVAENYPHRFKGNVEDPDFSNLPAPLKLCIKTIESIKDFRQYFPVVGIFSNPALCERHWNEMSKIVGFDLTPNAGTTANKIINMHLEKYLDRFETVSISASKEKQLQDNLSQILTEWSDVAFTVNKWKDTDILVLSHLSDIQAIMDDHYVKTLAMRGSAFVKPCEAEIREWYEKLTRMMKTFEEWGSVQAKWLHLLPIFSSQDIVSQLPEEGKLFQNVDQSYRRLMNSLQKDSRVVETAGALSTSVILQECMADLEKVSEGVAAYLEEKRLVFPRFFFLSNDELLEILSETKDPLRVQPHMKKCFEGIAKVGFDPDLNICAMFSGEGEIINFLQLISVAEARGSVEKWLNQVEEQMVVSLRSEIEKSYEAYPRCSRASWVLQWAGQVMLCAAMIHWTEEVEKMLRLEQAEKLREYHKRLQIQLQDLVVLVRGKVSKQSRIVLGALIMSDVHAKDVIEDLVKKKFHSELAFTWLAQLRYYWEHGVKIRNISATINYAYEYLGNTPRLVVTPLTDRCYRTLIGAYHLHLSGAPEGPAGTGKTETVKDLAKVIAVRCVVFNCSDGLDYIAMGKFFKGLASSGAWACFDEFNRIELDVLSVIAQQILCIMQAVQAGVKKFLFEGTQLNLNPACYICITMNPGYAGCSELPDNLKVLFRTVAMMVPDFALIAEVSLYSYGFMEARSLSVKIVTVYRLCSEQLSSQDHYDYGMRAVKTVLTTARNLKLKFPDEKEEMLVLRSIIDVNHPKFLPCDVPLFEGIVSDLFPGVVLPQHSHNIFLNAAREVCKSKVLQPVDAFLQKVVQTYEMMTIRHGFMLVGEPFGGKTCALKVLADTLRVMEEQGHNENKVKIRFINPRAVTVSQLYGWFDPLSNEWTDGIVATTFRKYSTDESPDRKWLIFDGPVDPVWVENMNTVLDDNKKLCLNCGEVIVQTVQMSMIFEVMDLSHASPATVSRCGMIYMEPSALGWKPLALSWIQQGNLEWVKGNEQFMEAFLDWLVPPCLLFVKKHGVQLITGGVTNLVVSTMILVKMLLEEAVRANEDKKYLRIWIQAAFVFAGVWGIGGNLDTDSQIQYDEFYKTLWKGLNPDYPIPESLEKVDISIPGEGTLYDYTYNFKQKGSWKYWPEILKTVTAVEKINIYQMLIPTVESMRYQYLMELHIRHNHSMLMVGNTGTGKSFCVQNMLMHQLPEQKYIPALITFTAHTTANQTQELVLSKLHKRRKGLYGPPVNTKCVIFVDDLNMPVKDKYGAQPAVELLRQFFDHGHWYDLKDASKVHLYDLMVLAAMGLPGGSRQDVCQRFLRHFSIYAINEFTAESMTKIFTNVLSTGLRRNGFTTDVASSVSCMVNATLDMYKAAIHSLLPTPAKSHYLFNLRDFSRVIQGCALLRKESADSKKVFVKLWVHEVLRVFYDRLTDERDRQWFYRKLCDCVQENFKDNFDILLETLPMESGVVTEESLRFLMFGNFMNMDSTEDNKNKYEEIPSLEAFVTVAEAAMVEYNSTHKEKMDVVLFRYALEHLSRICRILTMPCGSGLLVGVGGSGRQSLTKLASAIQGNTFFQPEVSRNYCVNEWRDDLKTVLKLAGGHGKETTFLFTDGQIEEEVFLQDIDSLLNSGEVPNLYAVEEQQEILELVRLAAQGGDRNLDISALAVFSFFISRCKQKLHIVLCFSPIGASFRSRLRLYPSFINCCTIDWFLTWPEEALEMVALRYMTDLNVSDDVKKAAVIACRYLHVSMRSVSDTFFMQEGRKTYITSAAYIDLIRSYTELTNAKQDEIMDAKLRYVGGVDRLLFAAEQVTAMQRQLSDLKPQLVLAANKTQDMMIEIEKETVKVATASAQVRADEKVANLQAAAAQELKNECEADLAQTVPILEDTVAALNTLKPTDITLVKSMKNPPDAIKLVMAAVCVMKGVKPDRINDPVTGRMVNDYWGPSKRVLGDMYFLQSFSDFDKDNIPHAIMKKIRTEYLPNKDFKPSVVSKASSAAEGLCKWVIAMDMYDRVAKEAAPKKAKFEAAEAEYNDTMALLEEKRSQLQTLETELAELRQKLEEANKHKKELEDEVHLCENKLVRAEKLIGGLGGEKARWASAANALQENYESLAGDILICCGIIAYLSPFTTSYRNECVEDWRTYIIELNIPCSRVFNFQSVLGSDMKIQNWNIAGLPMDSFSIENAIIVDMSRRYSLLVDPEGQANRWIKTMERKHNLQVIKFSDHDYMKTIESAIQLGNPVLLENVGEQMEAALKPLLKKQVFCQAGGTYIRLGETVWEYSDHFRFYLTSKLRKPHFLPEVYSVVTIVNFALALEGLEDQLLGIVVAKERPDLEDKRKNLIVQSAANKKALKEIEDNILITLSQTKGNILEDESAIEVLDSSKLLALDITRKDSAAKEIALNIETFRHSYKPIACYSSILYYCITDLPNLNPMYQYSLDWFINLYITSVEGSNKSRQVERRLEFLRDAFTYNLYCNLCCSLFDKDKMLFSFILCSNIMISTGKLDKSELKFFLTEGVGLENEIPNPDPSWLTGKIWDEICHLDDLPAFSGFRESFSSAVKAWQQYYDYPDIDKAELPDPWNKCLSGFQKLIIVRLFHPDKLIICIKKFIEVELGTKYVIPPTFDITKAYDDSNCLCPLIFIMSTGADPMAALMSFANKMGYSESFQSISLGQGQGPVAQAMIERAQREGQWVCLQNCHLAASWMPTLEKIWEKMDTGNTNISFRLWLTSCPSDKFPSSVLQSGIKMTNECSAGLKQNLLHSYLSDPITDPQFFYGCEGKERTFTRLLYALCFFHAVVQERRNFGSIGWNTPYDFNESDINISIKHLQMFIHEKQDILFEAITYLTGECNYGGRVADHWDQRTLSTVLADFVSSQLITDDNYVFSTEGETYGLPDRYEYRHYIQHIKELPTDPPPEVCGLHVNARINRDLQYKNQFLNSVSLVYGVVAPKGGKSETFLHEITKDILHRLPAPFDLEVVMEKFPVSYTESMNTVLIQEMGRFNKLLATMYSDLEALMKAIKGFAVMSPALEAISSSLMIGKVPESWTKVSYPSLKPLASYVADFLERIKFLEAWAIRGKPHCFWLSGFFFTQAFLAGAMQNYARKHSVSIYHLQFDFEILSVESVSSSPNDGVYVNGLFLEGARWDRRASHLCESHPRVVWDEMPVIWLKPTDKSVLRVGKRYVCPLYTTSERHGILTTTGHSTNFVLAILLNTEESPSHWIKRGVALLCQLNE